MIVFHSQLNMPSVCCNNGSEVFVMMQRAN